MAELPVLAAEDHVCPRCRLSYAAVVVRDIPERLRVATAQIHELIEGLRSAELTRRPNEDTWSALEYLCHVRDVYVASTIRLYRARKETNPQIEPVFNDLRVLRFRYNNADVHGVLHEMDAALEGLVDEMARTRDWERIFTRQPGEERTVRWLVRQALHEALHHADDMRTSASEPAG
jgi:hypothetical protein